jgi:flagellar protein FlaJ
MVRPLQPQANLEEFEPLKAESRNLNLGKSGKKNLEKLERNTLKRIKRKEKNKQKIKEKKPSKYVEISNKLFSKLASSYLKKGQFRTLQRDLVKANLQFLPKNYIAVIFFTTFLSFIFSIFIAIFFLFFNISAELPIIIMTDDSIGIRIAKVFWILILIPALTFFAAYIYPSLEKKSLGNKIDHELPFATIHMSAISGSMVEPSKIFSIIISTKEYPYLEKELVKLMNEINIFGYDLVTALRNIAFNSPSNRLTELFNGLATTITSGGNLPEFFDKRSQSLLFEYRLERERQIKTSETFMDIYISVVIAAPMIFMLLLMMMKISGLGISLSTSAITLIMILGVSVVNVIFLTFLQLKET